MCFTRGNANLTKANIFEAPEAEGGNLLECDTKGTVELEDCVGPTWSEWQHLKQQVKGIFRDQEEYVQLEKDY